MKHLVFLIFLMLFFRIEGIAQDTTQYIKARNCIVANLKTNVLYRGVDNPLLMSIPNDRTFRAVCDNGEFINEGEDWFIRVGEKSRCTITLFDKKGKAYGKYQFFVRDLPCPVLTIGGKQYNDSISKPLLVASAIIPVIYDFYIDLFFKVENFNLLLTHLDGRIENFSAKGNHLTNEMKASILQLESGSEVLVYDASIVSMNTKTDTRCNQAIVRVKIK